MQVLVNMSLLYEAEKNFEAAVAVGEHVALADRWLTVISRVCSCGLKVIRRIFGWEWYTPNKASFRKPKNSMSVRCSMIRPSFLRSTTWVAFI